MNMKPMKLAALAVATALVVTACGSDDSSDGDAADAGFDGEQVRLVVPTTVGGGFDIAARQIQPYLEDHLGTRVIVENIPGGGAAIGVNAALRDPQDCTEVLFQALPHLPFSHLVQDVDYSEEDLVGLYGISSEPSVIRVANDAKWDTIEDLIEDAKANPGEITVSYSSRRNNAYMGLLEIQAATGAEFNLVGYDGGGPARTAVVSGEVDVTVAGVFGTLPIADDSRVLAVHADTNDFPELTDNAPTLNEALGTDLAESIATYGLFVPKGCQTDHPERFEALIEATAEALKDQGYIDTLEKLGESEKIASIGQKEFDDAYRSTVETIEQTLASNPSAFDE